MKMICFACSSPIDDNSCICKATDMLGYKCYSCGTTGHIAKDSPALTLGWWLHLTNCPSCGESEVWAGSEILSGIATGGFTPR